MKKFVAGSILSLGMAAGGALAAPTYQLKGQAGGSTMYLSTVFLEALMAAGVETSSVKPATLHPNGRRVRFPYGGGVIDVEGTFGEINHAGGLQLELPEGPSLTFHNLSVEVFADPESEGEVIRQVTGVVVIDGDITQRLPLFEIDLEGSDVVLNDSGKLVVKNLGLLFTEEAGTLLDEELDLVGMAGEKAAVMGGQAKLRHQEKDDSEEDEDEDEDESKGKGKGKGKDKDKDDVEDEEEEEGEDEDEEEGEDEEEEDEEEEEEEEETSGS